MTIRATTAEVLTRTRDALRAEAQTAAGNALLSKSEQDALAPSLLKDAAMAVRAQGGSGARVEVDALVLEASRQLEALLGSVNTRGPGAVSQAEVRALHSANADAGLRVARAYELITGKHLDLPTSGTTPVPPTPPPAGGPLALSNLSFTSGPGSAGMEALASGNTLTLKGRASLPATLELDVGTRHVRLDFAEPGFSSYGVRTVLERLRDALPEFDLHVSSFLQGRAIFDFWPRGTAPKNPTPVYGMMYGFVMTGPLAAKLDRTDYTPGMNLTFRVDEKLYTVTARPGRLNSMQLIGDLASLMRADGRTVVCNNYGAMGSLRVSG